MLVVSRALVSGSAAALLLGAAVVSAQSYDLQKCMDPDLDHTTDIFKTKFKKKYSRNWKLTYLGTRKHLQIDKFGVVDENYNPVPGKQTHLLYQCGTNITKVEKKKFKAKFRIPVPVQAVVVSDQTILPYLEHFGLLDKVTGYVGNLKYVASRCLLDSIENFDVVLYENITDYKNRAPEHTADEVVLDGSYGEPPELPTGQKLVSFVPYHEKHPHAMWEWHGVIAALFNLDEKAQKQEKVLKNAFKCSKKFLRNTKDKKPKVAWAYVTDYGGLEWDVPPQNACEGTPMTKPYYCSLVELCGGELLTPTVEGSGPWGNLNNAEFIEYAKEADYLFFPGGSWAFDVESKRILGSAWKEGPDNFESRKNVEYDEFKFIKNNQVYDVQATGLDDWFESKHGELEQLGADICAVLTEHKQYKGRKFMGHKRRFLRNVFYTNEVPQPPTKCEDSYSKTCADAPASFTLLDKITKQYITCEKLKGKSQKKKKRICKSNTLVKVKSGLTMQRRVAPLCEDACGLCGDNVCFEWDEETK